MKDAPPNSEFNPDALNEEIGVIAGSRILNTLEMELHHCEVGQFDRNEDFIPFIGIDIVHMSSSDSSTAG